jgi:hypothetical protein
MHAPPLEANSRSASHAIHCLSWNPEIRNRIQINHSILRSILIIFFYVRLSVTSRLFLSCFQLKLLNIFLLSCPCVATCPVQLIPHDFIIAIKLVQKGQIMTTFSEQLKIVIRFLFLKQIQILNVGH